MGNSAGDGRPKNDCWVHLQYVERMNIVYVAYGFWTRCASGMTLSNSTDSPPALCGGMDEEFAAAKAMVSVS
jgi:hypothetical protein